MIYRRKTFFDAIRPLFGKLRTDQVAGMTAMLDVWEARYGHFDAAILAYCLATSFHETGRAMRPVRETFASSDASAISRLDVAFAKGRMAYVKRPYWRRDANGQSWFGRGHVQLTHADNYRTAASRLGQPLNSRPELALDPEISARILYSGCIDGWFTAHKLTDFINRRGTDFYNARKVVNPGDHNTYKLIEGYAHRFNSALDQAARTGSGKPAGWGSAGVEVGAVITGAGAAVVAIESSLWPFAWGLCCSPVPPRFSHSRKGRNHDGTIHSDRCLSGRNRLVESRAGSS